MSKIQVNGCGSQSGWLRWFRPPYAEFFRSCGNSHDIAYTIGGSEEDRKHADIQLYRDMVVRANFSHVHPAMTTWLSFIALLYYVSVRIFGKRHFKFHS